MNDSYDANYRTVWVSFVRLNSQVKYAMSMCYHSEFGAIIHQSVNFKGVYEFTSYYGIESAVLSTFT